MDNFETLLREEFGEKIKKDVLLSKYTTLNVGGISDFFLEVDNVSDLAKAVSVSSKNKIPCFILGGGSNVVVSDFGFPGLTILNKSSNIVVNGERGEVIADSGLSIAKFLNIVASYDLGGVEFLAGVPGSLGGAIYGNAGSKSGWIGDYVKSVTVVEERMGKIVVVKHSQNWMEFSYRNSKIKKLVEEKKFKPVILTARLRLPHKRKEEILRLIRENIDMKRKTQPIDKKSAGSFFRNPGEIKEQSAGYLLDESGAKKIRVGGAMISKKHANFVINEKKASAKEIRKVAETAKQAVFENYNIMLEEEIEYIGKW